MSTLSQFFNSSASSGAGGVSYFGTSGTLTVPSDVTYIAYGAIGAGSCGSIPGVAGTGAGGGFSWGESEVNCTSPFNLTVTVGSSSANGGFSSVTGGPTTICATGGLCTGVGGIGYGGVINTCGGVGSLVSSGAGPNTSCSKYCYRNGGGAGGLLGDGGAGGGSCGGGGFGSGGGGGMNSGYGGALGTPGSPCTGGNGLNGAISTPGFAVNYNLNGKLSQAKTFLSASGGGAGFTSFGCCASIVPAGAGGGGSGGYNAGFGGGSGAVNGGSSVVAGCGGGGYASSYYFCNCADGNAQVSCTYSCVAGGNGFVAVEYWK